MAQEIHSVRAYLYLRSRLIAGDFEPGTRLLYGPIGKEIGVSATPVREAAGRLANEGLVDLIPQIGAVVRTIGREELIEIYGVREVIEPGASAMAARKATDEQIAAITAEFEKMKAATEEQKHSGESQTIREIKRRFDRADYDFHIRVLEATGNKAIVHAAMPSQVLTRVFGLRKHIHDAESMQFTCDHHQAILDSIVAHKPEAAFAAAVEHIQYGLNHCLDVMDKLDVARESNSTIETEAVSVIPAISPTKLSRED